MRESVVRYIELAVVVAACYLAAVTSVQTTLYAMLEDKFKAWWLGKFLGPYAEYLDLFLIGVAVFMVISFWRKGEEAMFGRLFSLNMLLYFPAVLEYSTFNWVGLVLDYIPEYKVTSLWVFMVGLVLQVSYLMLRYTVRFREMREELTARGAIEEDIDQVTGGQMSFLILLLVATATFTGGVYMLSGPMRTFILSNISVGGVTPVLIGLICVFILTAGLVTYLRGASESTRHQ
jgi:hypothetical protein